MDDIIDQLRTLGAAAQDSVAPVGLTSISSGTSLDAGDGTGTVVDIGTGTAPPRDAPASVPRPRSQRRVAVGLVAAAVIVLLGAGVAARQAGRDGQPLALAQTALGFSVPDDNGWAMLRQCESGGDYRIDTGNTFYGAYQLTLPRWKAAVAEIGLAEYTTSTPAQAEPYLQDAVAAALYLEHGSGLWPICGRHIAGPMVTPVVAPWLGPLDGRGATLVFLEPTITDDRAAAIGELADSLGSPGSGEATYVDQEAAFEELVQLSGEDKVLDAGLEIADLPSRFETTASLSGPDIERLRETSGVLQVMWGAPTALSGLHGPKRLAIPALDLESPIGPAPTLEHLAGGVATMANQPAELVVGGYGSTAGSVFARLGELQSGDLITVTTLVVPATDGDPAVAVEVVRSFQVVGAPTTVDIDDDGDMVRMLTDRSIADAAAQRLTLVADLTGDPGKRLVVHASPVAPSTVGYPEAD